MKGHIYKGDTVSFIFIYLFIFLRTGFNVETIEFKNISFSVWDVGGQDKVLSFISFLSVHFRLNPFSS